MSPVAKGILAMIAACTVWGLSPLYWKIVAHLHPAEVLAHRTLWSAVTFTGILALQGRLRDLAALMTGRRIFVVFAAAVFISINWFVFIWSVGAGRVTEASLGYFLFPLVAVMVGRVVFGEQLSAMQWVAVALAAFAVGLLTFGLGVVPWIALVLAASFGLYGLIKKGLDSGPVLTVTGEVLCLSPIALAVLIWMPSTSERGFGQDLGVTLLLICAGVLTAVPLVLFSYGARRAPMSTVGLTNYLNPTLQFLVAVVIFAEPIGYWQAVAFPMIWTALAIYTWSGFRQADRAKRSAKAASSVSTSSTTST